MLDHPPYSLDLAPCDFSVPQAQEVIKGVRFPDMEAIKKAVTTELKRKNPGRILPGVHGSMAEQNEKVR